MKYQTRITKLTVLPANEPIFSEQASHISIEDEAAGEFIEIQQADGTIKIDPEEWPAIKQAVEQLLATLVNHEAT